MNSGLARIEKIDTCYQCRYGDEEDELHLAWCHMACRKLEDMDIIPSWCPLPLWGPVVSPPEEA